MAEARIRLRSNPTLRFECNNVMHNYSWDKKNPTALADMLRELIQLNYRHYGTTETDELIAAHCKHLKSIVGAIKRS